MDHSDGEDQVHCTHSTPIKIQESELASEAKSDLFCCLPLEESKEITKILDNFLIPATKEVKFFQTLESIEVTKLQKHGLDKMESEVQGGPGSTPMRRDSSSAPTKSNEEERIETAKILRNATIISSTLMDKLSSNRKTTTALFFKRIEGEAPPPPPRLVKPSPDYSVWFWGNTSYVKLPLSDQLKYWEKLSFILKRLKSDSQEIISKGLDPENVREVLGRAVYNYPDGSKIKYPFDVLSSKEISHNLLLSIPIIVDFALELPTLIAEPIPILRRKSNKTIFVSKRLCCSLLAHAFLSTYPEPWPSMPNINFIRLLNLSKENKLNVMMEKVMCILNYFHQMRKAFTEEKAEGSRRFEHSIISYERRYTPQKVDWLKSTRILIPVRIDLTGKIESKLDSLQVDFANRTVGGGIIGGGAVMEEILFSTWPELILSRLFTEALDDDEVLIIKGSQPFSLYEGYANSFRYQGPVYPTHFKRDALNRIETVVVAMDALNFKRGEEQKQYKKWAIDRELHKCFVAFVIKPEEDNARHIATGNWGCGAFNGDAELKFIIQLMAASQTGRNMIYHTCEDSNFTKRIQDLAYFLQQNKVEVGELYKITNSFHGEHYHFPSIFNFIEQQVLKARFGNTL